MINPCLLIPIYNHKDTIAEVLAQIAPCGLPCIIINDGSDAPTRMVLAQEAKKYPWVHVIHQARNGGKGAALLSGFLYADAKGYSHALQMDADGQHNTQDIDRFLAEATANPMALILGKRVFGADAPRSRYFGHKLSQWCAWAETLSVAIGDPLCGFRVYPLAATVALAKRRRLGCRMDFDPDIAVRLYWDGVPVRNVDTRVSYPAGGLSHFHLLKDNLRISWLHTRLLLGMVVRIPQLRQRRRVA
jgi:glycosyltransferase involved in cell wall biosynthesis